MLGWRVVSRLASLLWASVLVVSGVISCASEAPKRPIAEESSPGGAGGAGGEGGEGGEGGGFGGGVVLPDAGYNFDANCGYYEVDARQEPVRLYFVLDRSGSMSDKVGSVTKYASMRSAAVKLFERIGWRSEIGATLFPSKGGAPCSAGSEVFSLQKGDPKSFLEGDTQGPQAQKFAQAIASTPQGGTPTGKTLLDLVPRLKGLGPNTFVLLATDGGPNCNAAVTCEASQCIPNIEKMEGCTGQVNCCDPKQNASYSTVNCLDATTPLSAVVALAQAGVKTIVVGIPGSAEYATLLDLMAVAGGVPREGDTRYYRVDDLSALESLLLKIGSEVTVSCDITLGAPPTDPGEINVFFDQKILPQDEENGWVWKDPVTISLRGKACEDVTSGAAGIVRVVEGCPTERPKLAVGPLAGGAGGEGGGEPLVPRLLRGGADPAAHPGRKARGDLPPGQLLDANAAEEHQVVERGARHKKPSLDGPEASGVFPGGAEHHQPQAAVEVGAAGGQGEGGELRGAPLLALVEADQHAHRHEDPVLPVAQVGPVDAPEGGLGLQRVPAGGGQESVAEREQAPRAPREGEGWLVREGGRAVDRAAQGGARGLDAARVGPGEPEDQGPGKEARGRGDEGGDSQDQQERGCERQGEPEPAGEGAAGAGQEGIAELLPGRGRRHEGSVARRKRRGSATGWRGWIRWG